jgi:hypothetical protein
MYVFLKFYTVDGLAKCVVHGSSHCINHAKEWMRLLADYEASMWESEVQDVTADMIEEVEEGALWEVKIGECTYRVQKV